MLPKTLNENLENCRSKRNALFSKKKATKKGIHSSSHTAIYFTSFCLIMTSTNMIYVAEDG
jgi:hypothetical protein